MHIREFALERFFAKHEFAAKHILGASDVEGLSLAELLELADPECHRLWSDLRLGYTESPGLPLLRSEIASLYDGLTADHVLTFAGAEEAIFLTMHATLAPGDHAVVVWPAYQSLHEVARSIGADVSPVTLDPRDWSLDIDRLTAALRPNTRLVVINFPHSPTGAHIGRSQLDAIVRTLRRARDSALQRRGVPVARARSRRDASAGGDARRSRGEPWRDVEGLWACRTSHRLDRDERRSAPQPHCRAQGLHDDLQQRAE